MAYYSPVFSQEPYFTRPFSFSVEQYPFYRVEGVQGKDRDVVLKALKNLKDEYNLGFKVVAVRIDAAGDLLEYNDCSFGDLQEEYYFHRKKLISFLDVIYEYMKIARGYLNVKEGEGIESLDKVFEFIDERFKELKEVLPECLKSFDYSKFKSLYKTALNHFIDLLLATGFLKAIAKVLPAKDPDGVKSIDSMLSLLLSLGSRAVYKLIDSIFYDKLYRIYYRYTDRVYRRKLQLKFSRFAETHPGMEHLDGLRNHETLVLVYAPGTPTNPDPAIGKGVTYMPDEDEREKEERAEAENEKRRKKEAELNAETKRKILAELENIDPEDAESRAKMEEILMNLKR
jgi:hypothetical protein